MISIFHYHCGHNSGQWLDSENPAAVAEHMRDPSAVFWIDLDQPTEEEENQILGELVPIHPLSLGDVNRLRRLPDSPPHFPKVEEFPDYLLIIVNPLRPWLIERLQGKRPAIANGKKHSITQLSAVLTKQVLVTHHVEPLPGIDYLRAYLGKHLQQSERGPDFLFHLVLDEMVDQYAPLLDHIHARLDRLETRVLAQPTPRLLKRLLWFKHRIITLRKTLVYEREILARLARGEFALIDEREMVYYRNVYDHVVRFTELIETARETATDLMQIHLAATSNKLNEVMKALATISTIVLPMTLIAGIYGMNFPLWPPGEDSPWAAWGFVFALVIMSAFGVGSFLFFRWRRWI